MIAPPGRAVANAALARLLAPEHTPTPLGLVDLLGPQLDDYAELIVGPGGRPVGFMTRGEGPGFTERVAVALEDLGIGEDARAHHRALAGWFEHLRGFAKLEWHVSDTGVEPLAAVYFRRRPGVDEVCDRMAAWGIGGEARELTSEVARLLDKRTVHFVSAAFRPGHAVHHKLYFSQLVDDHSRELVAGRLAQVFGVFGMDQAIAERWRATHAACARPIATTLFVSVSFSARGVEPSFKIDYPQVSLEQACQWAAAGDRAAVRDDAGLALSLAGIRRLSFLGVRYRAGSDAPTLKYYADVPGR